VVAVVADLVEVVEAGPALRARAASALAPCIAALAMLALPAAARAVVLEDAVSITQLLCVSEDATSPPINEAVDYSCLGLPYPGDGSSTSGANASSKFGPAPAVSAHADCADAQGETSTWSSSRVSYELAIAQIATPPHTIGNVPVVISTMGSAVVSTLGMLGAGSTYVSSTKMVIFSNADVFQALAITRPQNASFILTDSYDRTETIDLTPDHVYFVDIAAGCNNSLSGTWACDADASVSFQLDQATFDVRQGANTFQLSQFFRVQQSASLVPEPGPGLLGMTAILGLAASRRRRAN